MLQRGAPKLGKDGKPVKDKNGKVIYEPYRIKVLNTINFKKSIQAEKDLAEEDAIHAQQPEIEEETPKPTLREQFEQYKPVVTAAISEDVAYRNACGHSDRENAVIEGNAAVRRAVLGSKDMELIRLYRPNRHPGSSGRKRNRQRTGDRPGKTGQYSPL